MSEKNLAKLKEINVMKNAKSIFAVVKKSFSFVDYCVIQQTNKNT